MKLFMATVLALAGSVALAGPASAATDGDFTFEISGGTATITDYDAGAPRDVVIPDTVTDGGTDYQVTAIGHAAFRENTLTSVVIPDSVTDIGDSAFIENTLTSITIPDSVITIEAFAFAENALTSVVIPDSVTYLGYDAFRGNVLTALTLGNSVTYIADGAFRGSALTSVTIPDTVTYIGEAAFLGNSLKTVAIPNSVTEIDGYAFTGNTLTSVTIGNSVATIREAAFSANPDLASVKFAGPAPAVVATGDGNRSFDTSSGTLLLTHLWRYDSSQTSGGFTRPKWEGYDTQAIATVDFKLNGHGATAPGSQEVVVGEIAAEPAAQPSASGFEFIGWYTDTEAKEAFGFSTKIEGDTTLYAGWEAAAQAPNAGDNDDTTGNEDNEETNGDAGGSSAGTGDANDGNVAKTGSSLPNTGGAPVGLLLIAGFALAVGATLMTRRRLS